jgi:hypothetical protein
LRGTLKRRFQVLVAQIRQGPQVDQENVRKIVYRGLNLVCQLRFGLEDGLIELRNLLRKIMGVRKSVIEVVVLHVNRFHGAQEGQDVRYARFQVATIKQYGV